MTLFEAKSKIQHIKIVKDNNHDGEIALYLDSLWQFGSAIEYRYHESLVTLPLCVAPSIDRVLLCGAGDGLAMREALRFPLTIPTMVELDPGMIEIFKDMPQYSKYNSNSMKNTRANIIIGDAINYMDKTQDKYDLVVWDFPSPPDEDDDSNILGLYTKENIQKTIKCLTPHGIFAGQISISITVVSILVKELMDQGFYCWVYDVYYDTKGNHDSILVASRSKLFKQRHVPNGCRFANDNRIKSAFSAATLIVPEDFDYYMNFLHQEDVGV